MKHFVGIVPPCGLKDYMIVVFDGRGKWNGTAFSATRDGAKREARRLRRVFNKKKSTP